MFDPVQICEILNEENVDYVVVGGFAAVIRGSSLPTRDFDIVPSRMPENLDRMDLTFTPAGRAWGYDGWRAGATTEIVSEGLTVVVASLDDVIDSKQAANRAKDHASLPYLESLREELRRQNGE